MYKRQISGSGHFDRALHTMGVSMRSTFSVSYTHLDVYKRQVGERLKWIMDVFADKVYTPKLKRQEVFFDKNYNLSLIHISP